MSKTAYTQEEVETLMNLEKAQTCLKQALSGLEGAMNILSAHSCSIPEASWEETWKLFEETGKNYRSTDVVRMKVAEIIKGLKEE